MSKLIRFDEDHFGYMLDGNISPDQFLRLVDTGRPLLEKWWPGKQYIFMQADEFIDLTGQYEIVPIADEVAVPMGIASGDGPPPLHPSRP